MKFQEIGMPSNRKFGYFFAVAFCAAAVFFFVSDLPIYGYVFTAFSVLFVLATVFNNKLLLPLNYLWFRFGMLLGMVVSPIVLGLIFFGLFTPLAFVMRLYGRDELCLQINKESSHWSQRKSKIDYESFKKQF